MAVMHVYVSICLHHQMIEYKKVEEHVQSSIHLFLYLIFIQSTIRSDREREEISCIKYEKYSKHCKPQDDFPPLFKSLKLNAMSLNICRWEEKLEICTNEFWDFMSVAYNALWYQKFISLARRITKALFHLFMLSA